MQKKFVVRFFSLLIIVSGMSVLAGWILGIPLLKSVLPGLVTMKFNTAFCFALIGLSLFLLRQNNSDKIILSISRLSALIVGLIGLLTLIEYIYGINLGIAQLFFPEPARAAHTVQLGRMALSTAFNFLLLACALLLLSLKNKRGTVLFQALAIIPVLIAINSLIGYLYGVEEFYGEIWLLTPMALHTAVLFLIAGVGILLARPNDGLVSLVFDRGIAGNITRRLFPASLGMALLLGWLKLTGEKVFNYSNPFGVSLVASANMLFYSILIFWGANLVRITEEKLNEKMENLERFNRLAVGRELKMKELKAENKKLKEKLEQHG